jgi:sugar phosphate isomerase/epimerase
MKDLVMTRHVNRRDFVKTAGAVGLGLSGLGGLPLGAAEARKGVPNAEKLGWRVGCGTWTFHLFTLFEAIDKTASLGLHYLEAGQMKLSPAQPNVTFNDSAPAEVRKAVKQKLADSGITLVSYGMSPISQDIGRKAFDFAKEMGAEMILCEPVTESKVEAIDDLCQEYKMSVAIHNHPKPWHYWNPDIVLKVCQGRSHRIGACADTGHWLRCRLNPVECLKRLEGRIISVHFKDLNQPGPDAHDVPWGTGVCDVRGMLAELHRQKCKAPFFVEYEYHWENSVPEIAQGIAYFDRVAGELATQQ